MKKGYKPPKPVQKGPSDGNPSGFKTKPTPAPPRGKRGQGR